MEHEASGRYPCLEASLIKTFNPYLLPPLFLSFFPASVTGTTCKSLRVGFRSRSLRYARSFILLLSSPVSVLLVFFVVLYFAYDKLFHGSQYTHYPSHYIQRILYHLVSHIDSLIGA